MRSVEEELLIHHNTESSQHHITMRILVQRCSHCSREMDFVEGDIIYGEKWFHGNCWELQKINQSQANKF